jgi:hypothetical protein
MAAKIQALPSVLYAGITAPLTPRRRGLEDGRGDEFETTLTVAPSTKYLMLLSESLKKMRRAPNSDDEANWHRTSLVDFPTNCKVAHIAQSSSSDSSRAPASICDPHKSEGLAYFFGMTTITAGAARAAGLHKILDKVCVGDQGAGF